MPYMQRTPTLLVTTFIALLAWLPAAAAEFQPLDPAQVGMSAARLQRLDTTMAAYVEQERIAGQVILVLRDGGIVYAKANGWRDREAGQPMTADTIFRIASQSKAIVSAGIMVLQEQGKLDIGQPLSNWFPEWTQAQVAVPTADGGYTLEPVTRPITLRDLLTHTSGISYGEGPAAERWAQAGLQGWYFADKHEPIGESVARMASLPIDAQPGASWIYGYSTDILGAVIERASGSNLASFLRAEIFAPLDMRDTHFYLPREKADRLAVVYQPGADGGLEAIPAASGMQAQGLYVEGNGPNLSYSGGAGLLSTARDYARFLQMLLNGGELDGQRILSPKTVELMTVNHLVDLPFRPGQGFGLGFWVIEDLGAYGASGSVGSYGWGGAYHSTYFVDPKERLVVVYMTQLRPADGLDDYAKLRSGVYQAIVE